MINYFLPFAIAFTLSLGLTPLVRRLALKYKWLDKPDERKLHTVAVPRLGGIAITIAFLIPFFIFVDITRPFVGLLAGLLVLFAVGLYDDLKGMSPIVKLAWQVLAACLVLAGGIGIIYLTNPLGGVLNLGSWDIPLSIGSFAFDIRPLANLVSIIWIVGVVNTFNFLDGLDGLATGIGAITCIVLFGLAISPAFFSVTVATLALILLGALLGFLPYNFFPSTIFMGDSGAYVVGLLLALLSVYNGSKIAVAALVLGLAIIDAMWTVLRRLSKGKSPFKADRSHLHHRLHDSGLLTHRQVVLLMYLFTALLAVSLLLFGVMLTVLLLAMLLIVVISTARILKGKRLFKQK